ncbi:MAG: hypothetical protein JWO30_1310 [Fibrobacteres bacterium]|nr:hypothetical protein [Fibrobacterota bacterium]
MNRITAAFSALSFSALTLSTLCAYSAMAAGTDLNGDKLVDAQDAQAFLNGVAAGAPPASLDLDGDGTVGLSDALLYGRWINGLYEKPSAGLSTLYFRNPADTAAFAGYQANKKAMASWGLSDLKQNYPSTPSAAPNYAPGQVQYESEVGNGMAKWASPAWDRNAFLTQVRLQGAAVSKDVKFPNYFQALDKIHAADLPLLVTTDAVLHSIYLSYDNILMELEENLFSPSLERILLASHEYARVNYGGDQNGQDVEEMLATALYLLNRSRNDVEKTDAVTSRLASIDGLAMQTVNLYGQDTAVDFSQFKPRGHYTRTPKLSAYFQAMMWLSRADLAFDLRAQGKGPANPALTRMKKDALTLWDCVVNSGSYPAWLEINRYVEYLVGNSDGLNMKGMGAVAQNLGIRSLPDFLKTFPEARFDSVMVAGRFGAQAILSQSKEYGPGGAADLDLSPICNFMPQRFILDSYTFSQTVFPLTEELMPSSQYIAFALGDNSALQDLPTAKGAKVYGVLGAQRALYDGISAEGWQSNMYTSWLGFLRKLNPAEGNTKVAPAFRTGIWRKKMRNTQLTSWAQLRHNTILYAKQSYTGGTSCSFPKAYVEPYPEFFDAVAAYARMGAITFKTGRPAVSAYFADLEEIALKLRDVALRSAQGQGPTDAQGAWLTTALTSSLPPIVMCGSIRMYDGWYMHLMYKPKSDLEHSTDFTIADVHTHPKDEVAPDMVLHEASGEINLAAVAVQEDSCVTMYVGPVGSFYEVNHVGDLKRYTDEEWTTAIVQKDAIVTRPAWTAPFLGP